MKYYRGTFYADNFTRQRTVILIQAKSGRRALKVLKELFPEGSSHHAGLLETKV